MYLIITNEYPSKEKLYANAFVHRRVINYLEKGLNVIVFVCDKSISGLKTYEFEGVKVLKGNSDDLKREIDKYDYEKLLIHIINKDIIRGINDSSKNIPILLWFHGSEGEAWYRRWFNYNLLIPTNFYRFTYNSLANLKRIHEIKKFIKINKKRIKIITVSNWFLKIIKKDIGLKNIEHYVIPNIIDTNFFPYTRKNESERYKILSIRPFNSRVYANDISVKVIEELSKSREFNKMSILMVGEGELFDALTKRLEKFNNVICRKEMLTQLEISQLHKEYGIFLSPARWDTHGVSRCEAMSSGLVPVTSEVAAIPEFVTPETGILSRNVKGLSEGILNLIQNPKLFKEMSLNSSILVKEKCSADKTILKELDLIKR